MIGYLKRALSGMMDNLFMTLTTLLTITLSVFIAGFFFLVMENADRMADELGRGLTIMAYLGPEFQPEQLPELTAAVQGVEGVRSVSFIHRDAALNQLKADLGSTGEVLTGLKENPLPHTLEIRLSPEVDTASGVVVAARHIAGNEWIEDLAYGQGWIEAFLPMVRRIRLGAVITGSLFIMSALFVSANTVRLAFCAKHEEIQIMRLVGATERFINIPFYLEGMIQGTLGGAGGILLLLGLFQAVVGQIPRDLFPLLERIHFLGGGMIVLIMAAGMFLGWFGCFIATKK